MTNERFQKILAARLERIISSLDAKGIEYATDADRLHNFKRAAQIGRSTPEKALMGMLIKHLVSIMDMVDRVEQSGGCSIGSVEVWEEKLGDAINYFILLEALVKER